MMFDANFSNENVILFALVNDSLALLIELAFYLVLR